MTPTSLHHFSNLVNNTGKAIKSVNSYIKDVGLSTLSKTKYIPLFIALNYGGGYLLSPMLTKYYMSGEVSFAQKIEKDLVRIGINNSGDVSRIGYGSSLLGLKKDTISAGSLFPYADTCNVIINKDLKEKLSIFASTYNRQVFFVYNHESAHCHVLKNEIAQSLNGLSTQENELFTKMINHFRGQYDNLGLHTRLLDDLSDADSRTANVVYLNFMENFADVRTLMVLARNIGVDTSDVFYKEAEYVLANRVIYNYVMNSKDEDMAFSTHDTGFAIKSLLDNFSYEDLNNIHPKEFNKIAYQIALGSTIIKMAENYTEKEMLMMGDYLKKRVGFSEKEVDILNKLIAKYKVEQLKIDISVKWQDGIIRSNQFNLHQDNFKEFVGFKGKINNRINKIDLSALVRNVYDVSNQYTDKILTNMDDKTKKPFKG